MWFLNTEHEYDLFGIQLLSVLFKSSCSFWRSQNYRIEGEQIQRTEKCTNNEDKTYLILEKEKKKKHKEVGCALCPCLLNLEHYWIWGWTRSASLCMYKCSLPVISNVKIFKKWITHPGWPHHNPGIHLLNGFLHYKCYSFKWHSQQNNNNFPRFSTLMNYLMIIQKKKNYLMMKEKKNIRPRKKIANKISRARRGEW